MRRSLEDRQGNYLQHYLINSPLPSLINHPVIRVTSQLLPSRTLQLQSDSPDSFGKVKLRLCFPPAESSPARGYSLASLPQLQGWIPDGPKPRFPWRFCRFCRSVRRLGVCPHQACCGEADSRRWIHPIETGKDMNRRLTLVRLP